MNQQELSLSAWELLMVAREANADSPVEFSMFRGGQKFKAAECYVSTNGTVKITLEEVQ